MGGGGAPCTASVDAREPLLMFPSPGEVYWAYTAEGGRHPIVVVSRSELNRGDGVIAVILTSSKLHLRRRLPNCVFFSSGSFGLPKDCVAPGESITFLEMSDLDLETGPIGMLDGERTRDLVRAIGYVISAECEPMGV